MKKCRISNPEDFGKVAVLMGGISAEREISIKSGTAVVEALQRRDVDVTAVDIESNLLERLQEKQFDCFFNMIHGRGGEDGVLQGVLEVMGLPYTGSGVLASALSMDKLRTKLCWQGQGMSTPEWHVLRTELDIENCINKIGFPVIVKPALEGSSIGMSKAENREELVVAWQLAGKYECDVYAEAWVTGKEYTVAVLADEALPVIGLETPHGFYDYDAKYLVDTTQYLCPCGLDSAQEKKMQGQALAACNVIGITGWARVDIFIDQNGQSQLIEVNTVPGMTDHSLVPMAAKAVGMGFDELVWHILETSVI